MTVDEFLVLVQNTKIDQQRVNSVELVYGKINDELAKKILSLNLNDYFLESEDFLRILSMDDILGASQSLKIDFISRNIIPFFDVGDNDFIVYHTKSGKWSYMNIVDEICFSEADSLDKLIK